MTASHRDGIEDSVVVEEPTYDAWAHAAEPVNTLAAAERMMHSRNCSEGRHVWVPWLGLPSPQDANRYVTFCIYCRRHEQYDL